MADANLHVSEDSQKFNTVLCVLHGALLQILSPCKMEKVKHHQEKLNDGPRSFHRYLGSSGHL